MSPIRKEVTIGNCRLLLGDSAKILPALEKVSGCLTDPPYGIHQARGMGGGGFDGFGNGKKRTPKEYAGDWDDARPSAALFDLVLRSASRHIIWGGNYFADRLPVSQKWLWWDKLQTMPSYSDGELAWTSLSGTSTKKFVYNGSGLLAKEKGREHPTQKPIELMKWCLGFLPDGAVIDPFAGSGSTGVACVKTGRAFIGIEIDPDYFAIMCRRVETATREPDMFVQRSPEPVQEAML